MGADKPLQYPDTPRRDVVEDVHGEPVSDPYRWLEDETDPEVEEWVETQNKLTQQYITSINAEPVYQELLDEHDVFTRSAPFRRGDRYYWHERHPGQHHSVLFSATDPGSEEDKQVVFDVNALSEDGSVANSFFKLSRQGSYAVYDTTEGGDERHQVYIRDMKTGEDEEFYFGRLFMMAWCDDEEGFYYTRSNYQDYGGRSTDEVYYQQVYFHRIGDDRRDDQIIFDAIEHLPKEAFVDAHASEDGRYVGINASIGAGDNETYVYLLDTRTGDVQELASEVDDRTRTELDLMDGYAYLLTNHEAGNYRALRAPIEAAETPLSEWEEFLPEDPERQLLGFRRSKHEMIVFYSYNATDRIDRVDRNSGSFIAPLDIPELATVNGMPTHREDADFYYSVSTFFSPGAIYHFDASAETSELFYQDCRSLDIGTYTAQQWWYSSQDGTRIPMFFIAPRDYENAEDNPVLLTGYGGFNVNTEPGFVGKLKPWLSRGGVLAMPNIRGGGEFGEAWHEGGMRENKQNTFDDFIAAAEYLVEERVTRPEKIALLGGSNGGLLVGACLTQRPDLFRTAVCAVPLLDMYRYHKFLLAYLWTHEYGDPDNPDEFEWLKRYSPYHHVDKNREHPSVLLTAGINDTRVHPMHAWKMAAALQNGHSDNVALLRTEMGAGHGPGKGFYRALHDFAEELAFIMHHVDMDIGHGNEG